MNKKQTIAYWARLLITYSLEVILLNSHTSLRSHVKKSCFVFHQGYQTPRNNKSNRPGALYFHSFFGVWNPWSPDETLALVFDILLAKNQSGCCRFNPCFFKATVGCVFIKIWKIGVLTGFFVKYRNISLKWCIIILLFLKIARDYVVYRLNLKQDLHLL